MEIKETNEQKKLRPPYISSGQADRFLDLLRRISPKIIDSKLVADNGIATLPNSSKVLEFSRWLGISDMGDTVKENILSKLKLVGEERDKFISQLITNSYDDLFQKVNLDSAKRDDITNYFVTHYNYGHAQAKYAARLFIYLCSKYLITLSDDIKNSYTSKPREVKPKPDLPKKEKELKSKDKEIEIFNIDDNSYIVSIRGKNTNQNFSINNRADIEYVESILAIIKKKLPES